MRAIAMRSVFFSLLVLLLYFPLLAALRLGVAAVIGETPRLVSR